MLSLRQAYFLGLLAIHHAFAAPAASPPGPLDHTLNLELWRLLEFDDVSDWLSSTDGALFPALQPEDVTCFPADETTEFSNVLMADCVNLVRMLATSPYRSLEDWQRVDDDCSVADYGYCSGAAAGKFVDSAVVHGAAPAVDSSSTTSASSTASVQNTSTIPTSTSSTDEYIATTSSTSEFLTERVIFNVHPLTVYSTGTKLLSTITYSSGSSMVVTMVDYFTAPQYVVSTAGTTAYIVSSDAHQLPVTVTVTDWDELVLTSTATHYIPTTMEVRVTEEVEMPVTETETVLYTLPPITVNEVVPITETHRETIVVTRAGTTIKQTVPVTETATATLHVTQPAATLTEEVPVTHTATMHITRPPTTVFTTLVTTELAPGTTVTHASTITHTITAEDELYRFSVSTEMAELHRQVKFRERQVKFAASKFSEARSRDEEFEIMSRRLQNLKKIYDDTPKLHLGKLPGYADGVRQPARMATDEEMRYMLEKKYKELLAQLSDEEKAKLASVGINPEATYTSHPLPLWTWLTANGHTILEPTSVPGMPGRIIPAPTPTQDERIEIPSQLFELDFDKINFDALPTTGPKAEDYTVHEIKENWTAAQYEYFKVRPDQYVSYDSQGREQRFREQYYADAIKMSPIYIQPYVFSHTDQDGYNVYRFQIAKGVKDGRPYTDTVFAMDYKFPSRARERYTALGRWLKKRYELIKQAKAAKEAKAKEEGGQAGLERRGLAAAVHRRQVSPVTVSVFYSTITSRLGYFGFGGATTYTTLLTTAAPTNPHPSAPTVTMVASAAVRTVTPDSYINQYAPALGSFLGGWVPGIRGVYTTTEWEYVPYTAPPPVTTGYFTTTVTRYSTSSTEYNRNFGFGPRTTEYFTSTYVDEETLPMSMHPDVIAMKEAQNRNVPAGASAYTTNDRAAMPTPTHNPSRPSAAGNNAEATITPGPIRPESPYDFDFNRQLYTVSAPFDYYAGGTTYQGYHLDGEPLYAITKTVASGILTKYYYIHPTDTGIRHIRSTAAASTSTSTVSTPTDSHTKTVSRSPITPPASISSSTATSRLLYTPSLPFEYVSGGSKYQGYHLDGRPLFGVTKTEGEMVATKWYYINPTDPGIGGVIPETTTSTSTALPSSTTSRSSRSIETGTTMQSSIITPAPNPGSTLNLDGYQVFTFAEAHTTETRLGKLYRDGNAAWVSLLPLGAGIGGGTTETGLVVATSSTRTAVDIAGRTTTTKVQVSSTVTTATSTAGRRPQVILSLSDYIPKTRTPTSTMTSTAVSSSSSSSTLALTTSTSSQTQLQPTIPAFPSNLSPFALSTANQFAHHHLIPIAQHRTCALSLPRMHAHAHILSSPSFLPALATHAVQILKLCGGRPGVVSALGGASGGGMNSVVRIGRRDFAGRVWEGQRGWGCVLGREGKFFNLREKTVVTVRKMGLGGIREEDEEEMCPA